MARNRKSSPTPSLSPCPSSSSEEDPPEPMEEDQPVSDTEAMDDDIEANAEGDDGDDDDEPSNGSDDDDDEDEDVWEDGQDAARREIARKEKERLRKLQEKKKEELMKLENRAIDDDIENRLKGRMNYLIKQTELFQHFLQGSGGSSKASKKKNTGKARYSKAVEEEEDVEAREAEISQSTFLHTQPSCIQGTMRDYQLAGLNWMIRLYENGINGILADEMGLGKTLQSISLLGYLREFRGITGPHMVVAPKSTLGNWMREIQRFCPVLRAIKFLGKPEERTKIKQEQLVAGKFDVCVISYEMVIKEKAALKKFKWRYIIIDEAHRIKNEQSLLSRTMRLFSTNYRLLITGTPLQNNLHELWALLNFLLPELFSSSETFDEWFQQSGGTSEGNEEKKENEDAIKQLHTVLRPFLLRRLKADVEKGLPPKKETILKVGMSEMQKKQYKVLIQKDVDTLNNGAERRRLLNVAMQLRKCCNHPYLFPGLEPGPPYTTGEHLIETSGKMVLLDRLLPKLKQRNSRVLIFSQMTRLLDILEDYCQLRTYKYCRIDGNTHGDDRENSIEAFNKEGSEKFIFLLSTRAGGLGINLATADTVILYDSDWNPQVDLQAQDRAHRIGQKKEVQVFRFCTELTIEEKVIERAYKKLALDARVIQQGRLAENKAINKDELLNMVRFGADKVFSSNNSSITDEDIDRIIAKGEAATAELDAKMKKFTQDALRFKLDDTSLLNDEKEEPKIDFKKLITDNWVEPPKRERKRNYSETQYFKDALRPAATSKPKDSKNPKLPKFEDFQFFNNIPRLSQLCEKEDEEGLTAEEKEEKEQLSAEGFGTWNKKEFLAFLKACGEYGRSDIKSIAADIGGKTEEEVQQYATVFNQRYKEIAGHEKFMGQIEKGEARIARKDEIIRSIEKKLAKYRNPWQELKIQYGQNKGKLYNEECDRFMICMTHKLGYGNWEELKTAFRSSPLFRFDWFVKSRSPPELARRCDTLVRLIEKEIQETEEREHGTRKDTKKPAAKGGASPAGRSWSGSEKEEPAPSKKRKQTGETSSVAKKRR